MRVDLAAPIVRLRSWARRGDVQAITKLLNFALAPEEIQVSAILKNLTLEIFCTLKNTQPDKFPAIKIALKTITPLLLKFTPQGIQCATIYGVQSPLVGGQVDEPPVWMHSLNLPALGDPKFAPTPIILAARGDEDALGFSLERSIDPDLKQCLAIGWIDLYLLRRQQLLHIMSEAPIYPIQSQVAMTVVRVMRQLRLPEIKGIRVHRRISGQSIDVWADGVDFDRQPLDPPPVTLERPFAHKPPIAKIGLRQLLTPQQLPKLVIWADGARAFNSGRIDRTYETIASSDRYR